MIVLLHGILGAKSNWATPAKAMLEKAGPLGWKALLIDHRGHGLSPGGDAPHSLEACAQDVLETLLAQGVPVDEADIAMCGHSFGGKVALMFTRARLAAGKPPPKITWVFDSPLGCTKQLPPREDAEQQANVSRQQGQNPGLLIPVLEAEAAEKATYADRNALLTKLESVYGVSKPLAQWLAQTVRKTSDGGIELAYNMPVVRSIYDSYSTTDMWHCLDDERAQIGVVVAGKNRAAWGEHSLARLKTYGANVHVSVLEEAGHNVHVDDRPGLLSLLESSWT